MDADASQLFSCGTPVAWKERGEVFALRKETVTAYFVVSLSTFVLGVAQHLKILGNTIYFQCSLPEFCRRHYVIPTKSP